MASDFWSPSARQRTGRQFRRLLPLGAMGNLRKKRVRKAFRCLKQATHFSHPLKEYRNSYILYGHMRADILTHGRNTVSKISKQSADRHSDPVVLRGGNNSCDFSRARTKSIMIYIYHNMLCISTANSIYSVFLTAWRYILIAGRYSGKNTA